MAPLPDYDQLKSIISEHWDPGYPASTINDKEVIELIALSAEEANLSFEEYLLREATANWSAWLDRVRTQYNTPTKLSSRLSEIEKEFSDSEEVKACLIESTIDESKNYKYLLDTGIIDLLAEPDLSSYPCLNEVAEKLRVKSWQLTEYIERLRDDLGILPLHYAQNRQADKSQQAIATRPTPGTDTNTTIIDHTTFDPSQSPITHTQPSKKSYLIPALLSGIGLLLIILITVILKEKISVSETHEKSSINKNFTSNQAAQNMLDSPKKRERNITSTAPLLSLNQIEKKPNCRFPKNESSDEFGTCKVVKRTNANNHIVYDVYPHFENLNKFAVVLWNNNTAEFFYEGERYEATTSDLEDKFIQINANDSDYKFSFIPTPHS